MLSLFIFAFVAGSKRKIEDEVDATQAAPKRVSMPSVFRFFYSLRRSFWINFGVDCMQKSSKEIFFPGAPWIARSEGLVEGGYCGKVSSWQFRIDSSVMHLHGTFPYLHLQLVPSINWSCWAILYNFTFISFTKVV